MEKPFKMHGRIFFDEYQMPDPDAVNSSLEETKFWTAFGEQRSPVVEVQRSDLEKLREAARAYLHFVEHPAGNTSILKQLREVRNTIKKLSNPQEE